MQKRNLAFYKESEKDWTPDELKLICEYCEDDISNIDEYWFDIVSKNKFIFDDGDKKDFMYPWDTDENLENCEKVSFESVFGE